MSSGSLSNAPDMCNDLGVINLEHACITSDSIRWIMEYCYRTSGIKPGDLNTSRLV